MTLNPEESAPHQRGAAGISNNLASQIPEEANQLEKAEVFDPDELVFKKRHLENNLNSSVGNDRRPNKVKNQACWRATQRRLMSAARLKVSADNAVASFTFHQPRLHFHKLEAPLMHVNPAKNGDLIIVAIVTP